MADRPFALVVGGVDPRQMSAVFGAVECHDLNPVWIADLRAMTSAEGPLGPVPDHLVPFDQPPAAAEAILAWLDGREPTVVVTVDGSAAVTAALVSEPLESAVGHANPPSAVGRVHDRLATRLAWFDHGVPHAEYRVVHPGDDAAHVARLVGLPAMVAPVQHHDDLRVFIEGDTEAPPAVEALRSFLRSRGQDDTPVVIEREVGGRSVIVWGGCTPTGFTSLAVVELVDSGSGPAADLGIVAPARLSDLERLEVDRVAADAVASLGLVAGPVAVTLSLRKRLVRALDVEVGMAPRCLTPVFGPLLDPEHLAGFVPSGAEPPEVVPTAGAVGILEIRGESSPARPSVRGLDRARALSGVDEVIEINLVSPAAGMAGSPLAQIVARGTSPDDTEATLRAARAEVEVGVAGQD